jgi:cysteine desulfurase
MKVYLDNNATTPLLPEVKQKIAETLDLYANPSSLHQFGKQVKRVIDGARRDFASALNKTSEEFIFTSSGTESNNMVLKGIFLNNLSRGKETHIITSEIEHPSIINTCEYLRSKGAEITYISVDKSGMVNIEKIKQNIKPYTSLISVMYANNETGVLQPVEEIGRIAGEFNIPFHSDAVQAFMKIDVDMDKSNIDFLTLGGHKFGAPKGIGALFYNNNRIHLIDPLLFGGSHENNLRASTENLYYIIAFAEAVKVISKDHDQRIEKVKRLTNRLKQGIEQNITDIIFNSGDDENRLPNTLNYSFPGIEGQSMVLSLDAQGIAVSTGSACSQANDDASYVILAMGRKESEALSSIRFSTGWQTTEEEIDYTLDKLTQVVKKLRG